MTVFFCPGIYYIVNKKTSFPYIGESDNLLSRLARHYYELEKNIHENADLQKDWNSFEKQNFEFIILYMGNFFWKLRKIRLMTETEYKFLYKQKLYNKITKKEKKEFYSRDFLQISILEKQDNKKIKNLQKSSTPSIPVQFKHFFFSSI